MARTVSSTQPTGGPSAIDLSKASETPELAPGFMERVKAGTITDEDMAILREAYQRPDLSVEHLSPELLSALEEHSLPSIDPPPQDLPQIELPGEGNPLDEARDLLAEFDNTKSRLLPDGRLQLPRLTDKQLTDGFSLKNPSSLDGYLRGAALLKDVGELVPDLGRFSDPLEVPHRFSADFTVLRDQILNRYAPENQKVQRAFEFFARYGERFVALSQELSRPGPEFKLPTPDAPDLKQSLRELKSQQSAYQLRPEDRAKPAARNAEVPRPLQTRSEQVASRATETQTRSEQSASHAEAAEPRAEEQAPEAQRKQRPQLTVVRPEDKQKPKEATQTAEQASSAEGAPAEEAGSPEERVQHELLRNKPAADGRRALTKEEQAAEAKKFAALAKELGFGEMIDERTGKSGTDLVHELTQAATLAEFKAKLAQAQMKADPARTSSELATPPSQEPPAPARQQPGASPVAQQQQQRQMDPDPSGNRPDALRVQAAGGEPQRTVLQVQDRNPPTYAEAAAAAAHSRTGRGDKRLGPNIVWNLLHRFRGKEQEESALSKDIWDRVAIGALLFLFGVAILIIALVSL